MWQMDHGRFNQLQELELSRLAWIILVELGEIRKGPYKTKADTNMELEKSQRTLLFAACKKKL